MSKNALDILKERGFFNQCTDEEALREHLNQPRTIYCGFDPTASSMQLGNLVPTFALAHLQRAGHKVIVLMGGATGMIGDPSGKSTERQFLSEEALRSNLETMKQGFSKFIDFDGSMGYTPAMMVDNYDWTSKLSIIDWLRGIGKQFTVNYMMAKESVRARLEDRDQGISYTEFSYMMVQANDFAHLYHKENCTVQIGGADQWGNITAGTDLIGKKRFSDHETICNFIINYIFREVQIMEDLYNDQFIDDAIDVVLHEYNSGNMVINGLYNSDNNRKKIREYVLSGIKSHKEMLDKRDIVIEHHLARMLSELAALYHLYLDDGPFGLTFPLVTTATGQKLGKSEGGTIYLDTAKTSIWDFYQYLVRVDDRDVIPFLKYFTFLPIEEIEELAKRHEADPGARVAHKRLAHELTSLVHGVEQADRMARGAEALYAGRLEELDADLILQVFAGGPVADVAKSALANGIPLVDLAADSGLVKSKGEGKRMLQQGALYVNDKRAEGERVVTSEDVLPSGVIVLRKGKKEYLLVQVR